MIAEWFAGKGVLYARVRWNDYSINIFNTHFGAGLNEEEPRLQQAKELVTFYKSIPKADITFLGGDFNFDESCPEYAFILEETGLSDSYKDSGNPDFGYTQDHQNPIFANGIFAHEPDMRIDFIFYGSSSNINIKAESSHLILYDPVEGKYLSDHFGVKTTFSME